MNGLEIIGILGLVYLGLRLLLQAAQCIYTYLIRGPRRKRALRKEEGRWALVTGATDGIGKAYAHALAKRNLKIILVSRNQKKLDDVAEEIITKYSVEVKTIAVDFTEDIQIYDVIREKIEGLEIGVLVNNVGISYAYPELYLSVPEKENMFPALIRANIISVTKMCEIVMPAMVDRRSGVVINVSSLSALIPSPYLSLYAASKAFVSKFSEDLRAEYEDKGLVIQTVLPGYVATKMSKIRKSTWMAPSPDKYVASALSKLGVKDHTTGYNPHALMLWGFGVINSICPALGVKLTRDTLRGIRDKALRKTNVQVS